MRNEARRGRFVTDGSEKFHALIEERELTSEAVAASLGTSRVTVHGWRYGQSRPSQTFRLRIAVWSQEFDAATGRQVPRIDPASDWLLAEERELVVRLHQQLGAA
jgi:transcriptional regulator with XRE-family HTH domain